MITKEEFQFGLANILKELRLKRGWSRSRMASFLYIDDKTLARYEDGSTAPSAPELLWIFSQLNENCLPRILSLIYPNTYGNNNGSPEELRRAAAFYFENVASDQTVREFNYMLFGNHGSNLEPQMQMFTMYEHLPMQYRVTVAQMVNNLWKIANARGELLDTENAMPDLDTFDEGLRSGEAAAFNKSNSYTTI